MAKKAMAAATAANIGFDAKLRRAQQKHLVLVLSVLICISPWGITASRTLRTFNTLICEVQA